MDIYNYLGFIEKRLRRKMDLSLDNISKDLKISKGNLSEAENGKRILREGVFQDFLDLYNINFDFDPSLMNETEQLLQELMEAYIYKNIEKEKKTAHLYYENREKLERSLGCLYVPLIDVFLTHSKKPFDFSPYEWDLFSEVTEYLPAYSPDERALFFYIKAFTDKKKYDFEEANNNYSRALDELNRRKWPQLEGVIKLNYAVSILKHDSYFSAYLMVHEAHDIFIRHSNYRRALMCYNNEANYLIYLQSYNEAKERLNKVLLYEESFAGEFACKYAVSTMLFILALEGNFEQAIQFAKDHPMESNDHQTANKTMIPYCFYRTGRIDQCLNEIKKLSKEILADDDKALFMLLKAMIKKDSSKVEEAKKRMMRTCCKQYNWAMLMVLYQLLIFYYKNENETSLLIEAYDC